MVAQYQDDEVWVPTPGNHSGTNLPPRMATKGEASSCFELIPNVEFNPPIVKRQEI